MEMETTFGLDGMHAPPMMSQSRDHHISYSFSSGWMEDKPLKFTMPFLKSIDEI